MVHRRFEEVVLPHAEAAFNYARWLTRSEADAEDIVQEAYVRAIRFASSLRGDDARAWLLAIVRNTWYGRLQKRAATSEVPASPEIAEHEPPDEGLDPEALAIQRQSVAQVRRALEALPADFREVLVLRELEGLSYKEIAAVIDVPIGTVMSRLSRGRERLLGELSGEAKEGGLRGLS
jgi:RNA polymerase sigma-70 factor (ECF subfamily)